MGLYHMLVELLTNALFNINGELVITAWQQQVVELIALPTILILLFIFIKLIWAIITLPFKW